MVYLEHHLSQTSGVDPETQSVTGETPGNLMDNVLRTLAEVNNKLYVYTFNIIIIVTIITDTTWLSSQVKRQ